MPESPRWRNGELWFVAGAAIHVIAGQSALRTLTTVDCPLLLGLAFTQDGDVLVNDAVGRQVLKVSCDGKASLWADLSGETPYMINEVMMLADVSVVVGDGGFDILQGEPPRGVRLLCVSPEKRVFRTGSVTYFANGLVQYDGGLGLLVADSFGKKIWRYRLVPGKGLDEGAFMTLPDDVLIDGFARAADDTIWYADMHSGSVVHIDSSGTEIGRIATQYPHVTSCTLNDENTILFATVMESMPSAEHRSDGAVIAIEL